jgi:hypothetical protein
MPFSPVAKIDHDRRQVFGWAKIAVQKDGSQEPDWQGDIVDTDVLEEAVYKFVLDYRDAGANHVKGYYTGKMIESIMITKAKLAAMGLPENALPEGWWVGFQIDDDAAWDKVKKGDYQMFSIEGRAVRESV